MILSLVISYSIFLNFENKLFPSNIILQVKQICKIRYVVIFIAFIVVKWAFKDTNKIMHQIKFDIAFKNIL